MNTHLQHLLPWHFINNLSFMNIAKTETFIMYSGKCNKIHILNKSDQIKVKNRKYIKENDICKDKKCKTCATIVIKKNKTHYRTK
jgi:hypothetical protein